MRQPLKDLAAICAGQGAPQGDHNYCENGTPFVKAGNLQELLEGKAITSIQKVSDEVAKKHKLRLYPKGTILFAKSGMSCMKGYIYVLPQSAYVVSHLACITPNEDISEYLRYYFNYHKPNQLVKDAAYPSISLSDVGNLVVDMKPESELNEIVSVLQHTESIITLRQRQLQKLDELVKARFVELFGDPELNPRGLPVLPWNAVFLTTTGKLDSNAMVENGRYPFFTCAKESYKIDSYAFDCEALLLAGNNAAGIYDVKHYKGKFNAYQRTYVLRLMNEKWSYILFKRQLEDKLQYLQSQSKGTNTRYLTLGILNELRFVVPPVAEQEQFAVFVEQTDKSKVAVQKALDEAQLLFDSLMQKYFW